VIVQLSLLIFLLIVTGIGPGMLMTRRMRLAPLERLCTALGLSWTGIYLFSTAIYLSGISWHWTYVGSLIALAMFLATLRDTKRMLTNHALRRALGGLFLLGIEVLLLLALLRNYSGGLWSGDWYEHYERTEFFLHRGLSYHLFLGIYLLPARPPMMNLVAAFFLAQVGKGFEAFELCLAILNLTVFLPLALLLNQLLRRGARSLPFLVLALASSPLFAQNTTYTWTRLFCAFYILLGISLYLRGSPITAFVMLAAGCLIHYSAGPFVIFVAGHYLWTRARKKENHSQLLKICITSAALLCTWFFWAIFRYGMLGTLATNTSVRDASRFTVVQNVFKIAKNISDSLLPPLFRLDPRWHDQSGLGFARDLFFFWYQQNLLLMMGSTGAVVAIWIVWRTIIQRSDNVQQRLFWLGFLVFCIPVSIATVGEFEPLGLAHAVLQPLALIGIAAVAVHAPRLPRWAFRLLMLGWAVDFCLGILLQFYIENQTFQPVSGPGGEQLWSMPMKLVEIAAGNFGFKQMYHLTFIGDHWANQAAIILLVLAGAEAAGICVLFRKGRRVPLISSTEAVAPSP
jgi:hypothetical protein